MTKFNASIATLGAALLLGLLPAWQAWRQSLHDGLSLRL